MKTFPVIRDLVTDVSFNFQKAWEVPAFAPRATRSDELHDGLRRMYQEDVDRIKEFHNCIECFLCQNVCHVIRDHEENKAAYAGPRHFVRLASLEMHALDGAERSRHIKDKAGIGHCNVTRCCTEVCPEHIRITDNAIIPLKERVADRYYDPIAKVFRLFSNNN
jgi:succinate dehydrogenase / fumarate reductase iron-sulfur subunit